MSDTLYFYQTTICYLRCIDRATARVGGTDYHAQDAVITLTDLNGFPSAQVTFPELALNTISPGETVTFVPIIIHPSKLIWIETYYYRFQVLGT